MKNEYIVTALVSVYNSGRFIEGCLRDLLGQTLGDRLEIIVIDTGSMENEGPVVGRFREKHGNISYIRTPQRETVYQAWNRGIKAAHGKYLVNANTDDRLRKDAYEIMARELDAHPETALVYGDILITGTENQTFNDHVRIGCCLRPDWSPEIMLTGCHMGPQPMWRKEVHEELGYFDESLKSASDYEFWCRIATRHSMRRIPDFLGLYLHNPKGVANSDQGLSIRETRVVQERYRDRLPPAAGSFVPALFHDKPSAPGRYVNIGMITYNRMDFTRQAVDALIRTTDFPHVLTVVDNGSRDGTREYLREQKKRGVIRNLVLLDENIGVARASNLAWLMEPAAGYYMKLDNDIVMGKKGWLTDMAGVLDRVPRIGVAGYNFETTSYPVIKVKGKRVRVKRVGNLGGACVLIPRRTWEKIGFWCEEYGFYGEEDGDYAARVSCLGQWNAYLEDENAGFHLPAGRAADINISTFVAKDGKEEVADREYREWKDRQRKINLSSGRYQDNLKKYRQGRKTLYAEPFFARHYLESLFPGRTAEFRRRFVLRDFLYGNLHRKTFHRSPWGGRRFPESRLAHQYLDGLRGVEIGGSAHNGFGLPSLNVDLTWKLTHFKAEELAQCGTYLRVDLCARGDGLPFRDGSWDYVLSSHVLEHFDDPIRALKEWYRVVRPGGYIFIIVPHRDRTFDREEERTSLEELIRRHSGEEAGNRPASGHASVWKTSDLLELVGYLGWKVTDHRDVDDKVGNGFTVVIRK